MLCVAQETNEGEVRQEGHPGKSSIFQHQYSLVSAPCLITLPAEKNNFCRDGFWVNYSMVMVLGISQPQFYVLVSISRLQDYLADSGNPGAED